MHRFILCFPRDIPSLYAFRNYEVYEFYGTMKELLISLAEKSLEFGSNRTFTSYIVLREDDWHDVLTELDRYDDFYLLIDKILELDLNNANKIARDLGIQNPALVYMIWESEAFINEEIEDLINYCKYVLSSKTARDEKAIIEAIKKLESLRNKAVEDPMWMIGVEFAFLNLHCENYTPFSGRYFVFVGKFSKFMIAETVCRVKIVDSKIFDSVRDERELLEVLRKL